MWLQEEWFLLFERSTHTGREWPIAKNVRITTWRFYRIFLTSPGVRRTSKPPFLSSLTFSLLGLKVERAIDGLLGTSGDSSSDSDLWNVRHCTLKWIQDEMSIRRRGTVIVRKQRFIWDDPFLIQSRLDGWARFRIALKHWSKAPWVKKLWLFLTFGFRWDFTSILLLLLPRSTLGLRLECCSSRRDSTQSYNCISKVVVLFIIQAKY